MNKCGLWLIIVAIVLVQCKREQVEVETKQSLLTPSPTEQHVVVISTPTKSVPTKQIEVILTQPARTSVPDFTYVTHKGSIWQVNINGEKKQLLPDDGVEKRHLSWSPDRQQLAYIIREWPQNTEEKPPLLQESLVIINVKSLNPKQMAGPTAAIKYNWIDDQKIKLQLADELSDGSERQQWDYFVLNVDTGERTPLEQPEWSPIVDHSSPDDQWAFEFEEKANKRLVYLLDANGNKVDIIHEQPAGESWTFVWSPNSRYILYYPSSGQWNIYVYDLTTRKHKNVTRFGAEPDGPATIWGSSWGPAEGIILIRRETDHSFEEPCLINIFKEYLRCFDISAKSGEFVWSVDGDNVAFIAPRGDEKYVDVYAIDVWGNELFNLTKDGDQIVESSIACNPGFCNN